MYWAPVNYGPEQWYYYYGDNRYVEKGPSAVAHFYARLPPPGSLGPVGHGAQGSPAGSSARSTGSSMLRGSAVSGASGSGRDRPSYRDRDDRGPASSGGRSRSSGGSRYGSVRSGGVGAG